MTGHQKLRWPVKRVGCCVQDQSHSKHSFKKINVCLKKLNVFWTAELFVTKLDMVIHQRKPDCIAKNNRAAFKIKVIFHHLSRTSLFLLYFLNCLLFCFQILFDGTSSQGRLSCGKIASLCQVQGHSKGSKLPWVFF